MTEVIKNLENVSTLDKAKLMSLGEKYDIIDMKQERKKLEQFKRDFEKLPECVQQMLIEKYQKELDEEDKKEREEKKRLMKTEIGRKLSVKERLQQKLLKKHNLI